MYQFCRESSLSSASGFQRSLAWSFGEVYPTGHFSKVWDDPGFRSSMSWKICRRKYQQEDVHWKWSIKGRDRKSQRSLGTEARVCCVYAECLHVPLITGFSLSPAWHPSSSWPCPRPSVTQVSSFCFQCSSNSLLVTLPEHTHLFYFSLLLHMLSMSPDGSSFDGQTPLPHSVTAFIALLCDTCLCGPQSLSYMHLLRPSACSSRAILCLSP